MDIENKRKTSIRRAKKFSNTVRFINNPTVLNDGHEFERKFILQNWTFRKIVILTQKILF